jgi:MFS family permease
MATASLEDLESKAYQDAYADGLIDILVGLSLAAVGIVWLWIEWLPGLVGVVPAVFSVVLVPIRRRILEPRLGYVRWRAVRLTKERRQLTLLLVLVMAAFLAGNGFMYAMRQGDTVASQGIVSGLPAFVVAIGAFVTAATAGVRRLWSYGAVLLGAAVVTIVGEANPGGSLLASGVIVGVVGAVLLTRFLNAHPARDVK